MCLKSLAPTAAPSSPSIQIRKGGTASVHLLWRVTAPTHAVKVAVWPVIPAACACCTQQPRGDASHQGLLLLQAVRAGRAVDLRPVRHVDAQGQGGEAECAHPLLPQVRMRTCRIALKPCCQGFLPVQRSVPHRRRQMFSSCAVQPTQKLSPQAAICPCHPEPMWVGHPDAIISTSSSVSE